VETAFEDRSKAEKMATRKSEDVSHGRGGEFTKECFAIRLSANGCPNIGAGNIGADSTP